MHVISRRLLRAFWEIHPPARQPLSAWFRLMEQGTFPDFNAIRKTFGAADHVAPYSVFNIGGNKYRLVTIIHYNRRRVYIRHVFTHPEYDDWSQQIRSSRRGKR